MDTGRFRPGTGHLLRRCRRIAERNVSARNQKPGAPRSKPASSVQQQTASAAAPKLDTLQRIPAEARFGKLPSKRRNPRSQAGKLERTRTRGPPAGRICALRSTSRSCASPGASRAKSELRHSLIQLSAKTVPAQSTSPPTKRTGRRRDQRTQSLTFRTCCIATLASSRTPV
jgi:hypothetical protein